MNTLQSLEERLQRENPALSWQCIAADLTDLTTDFEVPQEIEIRATRRGLNVPGSPFRLNGALLKRWGIDSTARLICHEFNPGFGLASHGSGVEWDKLAEI